MDRRSVCAGLSLAFIAMLTGPLAAQESSTAPVVSADEQFVFQPAPEGAATPAERADAAARAARRSSRSEYVRLARNPNMFGDSIGFGGQMQIGRSPTGANFPNSVTDLPLGVGRSQRIAENNKPLPMDRVYFMYNGFQNALKSQTVIGPATVGRDYNVDMYTLGFEKTFFDGQNSIDVRLPLLGGAQTSDPFGSGAGMGNVGDMTIVFKQLLYQDDSTAMAAGFGLGLPTAGDVTGKALAASYRIHTESIHLTPYLGVLTMPNDNWFFQAFAQLDFAANGNPVDLGANAIPLGTLTEQNLFILNFSMGRWLFYDEEAYRLRGIAAIAELHYTTTLQDGDVVGLTQLPDLPPLQFGNLSNRSDMLNLTSGLHFQIGHLSNLRVSCAVPLRDRPSDRLFDSEILVSFNRFF